MVSNTISFYAKRLVDRYKSREVLIYKKNFRTQRWTYLQLYEYAHRIIGFFREMNIKKGDKVIIYSSNCPSWGAILFACAMSGVIAVPVDYNSKSDFVRKIDRKVNAKAIFSSMYKSVGSRKREIYIEDLFRLVSKYKGYRCNEKINEKDILEIVYTSGTTSEPKGVVITNKNLVSNVRSLRKCMQLSSKYVLLSVVPMSHLLEQTIGFFIPLRFGCKVVYVTSRKSSVLLEAMQEENVTTMVAVPIFLKTLKEKIEKEIKDRGDLRKFHLLLRHSSTLPLIFRRVLFRKVFKSISTSLKHFIVGGAPLDLDLEAFWNSLGVKVIQGYGLTETSPIMTCNSFKSQLLESVGRVLPDQEIKLCKDGEILCRGNNVFRGYYNDKKATASVIRDGWFYTGDLGELNKDGFLKIKGRKEKYGLNK